ncbi:4-phosphoerythronate dehydrogenase [Gynuella sp.]|uniref:4-phosphoerythronate dehydrogenase n=1 Tax=Gynuella sp. TaxID=2969146 RepID=UPI003D0F4C38
MKIVADENMPDVETLFGSMAEDIVRLPGRTMKNSDLSDADVLLVRSVTQVNAELLDGTDIFFVGSATIGTDHIDQAYLKSRNIAFHHSPGCNADSVVDYVLAAIMAVKPAAKRLDELRYGVVGCGNVGGRLARRLERMGLEVLKNDPPLADRQGEGFASLTDLSTCDVVCLHTPLTKSGQYPTYHLIDEAFINALKPGCVLVNAGRGPVIKESALLSRMQQANDLQLVLDVWETEPAVSPAMLPLTKISTPHIAGYSLDGKLRGTWMLYKALCEHLGKRYQAEQKSMLQLPKPIELGAGLTPEEALKQSIAQVYNIYQDSQAMRQALHEGNVSFWAEEFDQLRKDYPVRREFGSLVVSTRDPALAEWLTACGFDVKSD